MRLRKIIFIFLILFSVVGHGQQDVQFTQYMYNMSVINPAYTGSQGTLSISAMGRTQWAGIPGAPLTFSSSINAPVGKNMGLGLSLIADQIGPVKEQNVYGDYSYTIKTANDGNIAFGIKAGVTFQSIDFNSLSIEIEDDPLLDRNNLNKTFPNFGAGVFYYNDQFYAGLSMPNIIESRHFEKENGAVSYASEKMHFFFATGYVFDVSQTVKLKPSIMMKGTQGAPLSIDFAGNLLLDEKIEFGIAYRLNNTIIGMLNLHFSKTMRIGYAYDYTMSNYSQFNSGSHEIFLLYNLVKLENKSKSLRVF